MNSMSAEDKFIGILRANDILDEVSKVTFAKPDLKGEHMGSVIETVRFEFSYGMRDPLKLFVKKRLPNMSKEATMSQVMINEGTFLTDFVQEMKEFREKRKGGPDLSDLFPRVYHRDGDMIVIEDLTERGFQTIPKKIKRNFEETRTVFEHLAKLHAVSHVMIKEAGGPENFIETRPYLRDYVTRPDMKGVVSGVFEPSFEYCVSILKKASHKDQGKAELLEKYCGKMHDAFLETVNSEAGFLSVNHGDCWTNNVMFDTETRTKVILVDLQAPRVNSPAMDLIRFLFFSCGPDVRGRWKELLQIYFDTLKQYVLDLEHPFPFQFEDFVADFSRKGKMDFLNAFLLVIGFGAIENHDTENSSADAGVGVDMKQLLTRWVEKNPGKLDFIVSEMVEMIDDFLLFSEL